MGTERKVTRLCSVAMISLMLAAAGVSLRAAEKEKQPIHGLVTMGGITDLMREGGGHADNTIREANVHPGVYSGVVLLFGWNELEPAEGKLDVSRIEEGLDAVRAYNKKYPETPVKAKFRIFAGWNTPEWVIAKSGAPITLENKHGAIRVGRFWTAPYRNAWNKLQSMLAERYDDNPLVGEVAVSSCATMSAEPFVLPLNANNIPKLHAAGYTDAAFKACLMGAIDDYSHWKDTPIDYTANPFRYADSGKTVPDDEFTIAVLKAFREKFGKRGVIANHGLQSPLAERQMSLYTSALKKLGPPIEFQTISPAVDWDASFEVGLQYGATEIEIWNTKDAGGSARVSYDQLKKWAAEMRSKMPR